MSPIFGPVCFAFAAGAAIAAFGLWLAGRILPPDDGRRGLLIADIIARRGRLFVQVDIGGECPLSALTVLGHLPISIKDL